MSWIKVARTGRFTDMRGQRLEFTEATLDRIVKQYDPSRQEAPLVFGHPDVSDPAYGWVERLKRQGGFLLAKLRDVPDQVKKLIDEGRYRYVSMSLFKDHTLRHIGLLGANPPAIDGLGPVKLSAEGAQEISFAHQDLEEQDMNELEKLLQEIKAELGALRSDKGAADFAAKISAVETKVSALEGELAKESQARLEAEAKAEKAAADFAAYKGEQLKAAREARFGKLVEDGKALPAEKDTVLAFAATLATAGATLDFAAGDGKTEKVSQEEAYWRSLEAREANALTSDFATADKAGNGPEAGSENLTRHV